MLFGSISPMGRLVPLNKIYSLSVGFIWVLILYENQIGDPGLASLADACANGALAKIENIYLFGNPGNSAPVDKVLRKRKKMNACILS